LPLARPEPQTANNNNLTMKKVLAFIATIALFALILVSCKSHELCPAYGKVSAKHSTDKSV